MSEIDIRQRNIDSGAAVLLNGCPQWTPQQWREAASATRSWGAADKYARCAEIAEGRFELQHL